MRRIKYSEQAFALSDLLAIISIILLLSLTLFPSVSELKEQAWRQECLGKQGNLAKALSAYSNDNGGKLLPRFGNPGGGFWPGPSPFISSSSTKIEARNAVENGFKGSILSPYLEDVSSIHCPGDYRDKNNLPERGWGYDSYALSNPLEGNNWQGNAQPSFETIDKITDPAGTFAFIETADPRDYNRGSWIMNVLPSPNWVDNFGIFHGTESSFSFVDAHAEIHEWKDPLVIRSAIDSINGKNSFFWPGGNFKNPDFRWVYNRYKHQKWKPIEKE